MTRAGAILGSLAFLAIAPGTVAGLFPWWITGWRVQRPFLGQALLFGSAPLLAYALLFWLAVHLFVVLYEEPTLSRAFGEEYATFRANVPRWIPRVRGGRGAAS